MTTTTPPAGRVIIDVALADIDTDRRLAFGFAKVFRRYLPDGTPVAIADNHGFVVDTAEALDAFETAVYRYVADVRTADHQHERFAGIGTLVESVVFTPDKRDALAAHAAAYTPGATAGTVTERYADLRTAADRLIPDAWWVGFRVDDPDAWQDIKAGRVTMFSIVATAFAQPLEEDDPDAA